LECRRRIHYPDPDLPLGIEIKTNGTAILISVPIVVTGVVRHWLTGHYRSQSMLLYLVLPMSVGSLLGAAAGS
jgi:uncharacterized membrane protein YfcA